MKKTVGAFAAAVLMLAMACGSMNRQTPKQWDNVVTEADVRSEIVTEVPSKTFAVEIKVDHGVVTLSGHAASEADRVAIGHAANKVKGVTSVINNITVQ